MQPETLLILGWFVAISRMELEADICIHVCIVNHNAMTSLLSSVTALLLLCAAGVMQHRYILMIIMESR